MTSDAKIDALFQRLRRNAILLHRPYPPHLAADTNSRFGGLPALPEDMAWPRMKDGRPLHFLVQIDCTALPFECDLPNHGMLFFFALEDGDQVWDEAYLGDKGSRVVHAPHATGVEPLRAAPHDLPPISPSWPPPHQRPFLQEGEAGSNLHVEWPIELRRMDSWPDASALTEADLGLPDSGHWLQRLSSLVAKDRQALAQAEEEDRLRGAYHTQLEMRRLAAFRAASTYTLPEGKPEGEISVGNIRLAQRILEQEGRFAWPDRWVTIGSFCRALRKELERPSARAQITDADARIAAATDWIARADATDPAAPVPKPERDALRTWALSLRWGERGVALDYRIAGWIVLANVATVRHFAHNRNKAKLISPEVYEILAGHFQGNSTWGPKFSQMLGYAPSSQQARMTDDPAVCLVTLASDHGLGWTFGDLGEATFWISPEDLARSTFDAVVARVEGG